MRLQRYQPIRRRSSIGFGCLFVSAGGILLCIVAVLILLPALPGIVLRVAGFEARGSTDALFADSQPPIDLPEGQQPSTAILRAGSYGTSTFNSTTSPYTVQISSSVPLANASFDETGLLDLCYQYSDLCEAANGPIRNATIDLRPGGGVIYGEVYLPELNRWQNIGVVMQVNSFNRVDVLGIDLDGTLYSAPPGFVADQVAQMEQTVNDILNQLVLESGENAYRLSQVIVTDTLLTLLFR